MKRYLTYVSLQPSNYTPLLYKPEAGREKLAYTQTRLPVLPLINATAQSGETIEVILVSTNMEANREAYERNLRYTEEELTDWAQAHGVELHLTHIRKEETSSMKELLRLFDMLIQGIENNWSPEDVFYADITFGMKPMTLIMLYVLRYIRSIRKNMIESILYGQVYRGRDGQMAGELHDVTALFYMDSIIGRVGEMNLRDPAGVVRWSLADIISQDEAGDTGDE